MVWSPKLCICSFDLPVFWFCHCHVHAMGWLGCSMLRTCVEHRRNVELMANPEVLLRAERKLAGETRKENHGRCKSNHSLNLGWYNLGNFRTTKNTSFVSSVQCHFFVGHGCTSNSIVIIFLIRSAAGECSGHVLQILVLFPNSHSACCLGFLSLLGDGRMGYTTAAFGCLGAPEEGHSSLWIIILYWQRVLQDLPRSSGFGSCIFIVS